MLFVGGLSSSSTRDTAADAFMLAVEMLRGGNKQVQVVITVVEEGRAAGREGGRGGGRNGG